KADVPGYKQIAPLKHNDANSKGTISTVLINSSANIYTSLVEQQSCLTVDEGLGLIHFTHRANPNVLGAESGDIVSSKSTDGGDTWSSMLVLSNTTGYNNRYPSGTIYNPTGNTNPNQAFLAFVGPSHDGAATSTWDNNFFGSARLDSTNINVQYFPSYGALIRMGMETVGNKVHVCGAAYTDNNPVYTLDTVYLMTGTFNSGQNTFDWTTTKLKPTFVKEADGNDFVYTWHFNTAWSSDGTIGYVWTFGRDSAVDTRSYQPIVWKTINSGANWSQMPVFDFSTLSVITDRLQKMKAMTTSRPMFSTAADGVVDANGDLHLVCKIRAASSNHTDSLGYSFYVAGPDLANPLFDVYTTSTGWDALFLGKTYTITVPADESGYGAGTEAVGWDLRMQAGKTANGTKIFASWTDTDTNIAPIGSTNLMINLYPDIYAMGWDIISGDKTYPTNFTLGTSLDADCFFHFMSNIVLANGGTYTIPMTKTDLGIDPLSPVFHKYIKGIEFVDADFTDGITENNYHSFKVTQNYPNPFSDYTYIDIVSDINSLAIVDIYNVMGQKVISSITTNLHAGKNSLKINCKDLNPALYLYSVTIGDKTVTQRMMVK
ncbi:T9SS type A sorting domain-containing protein, partial [Bacteroidota bacterium]